MAEIYGHTWVSGYTADPDGTAGQTWGKGLAGLSGQDIARGLSACLASGDEFPPTLPKFRKMCMGIPSQARVAWEISQSQRSPFTCMVLARLDGYRYKSAHGKDAERLLRDAYELAVEARMSGEPLPLQSDLQIESRPEAVVPSSPETVARHMADIEALLNRGEVGNG